MERKKEREEYGLVEVREKRIQKTDMLKMGNSASTEHAIA